MSRQSILADRHQVAEAIGSCSSVKECLEYLGLRAAGGNYNQFYLWCNRHELIPPIWDRSSHVIKYHQKNLVPLSKILTKDSSYNRGSLKRRLVSEGILEEKCDVCDILPSWNGKSLTLQLDHRNGIYNDNRLTNLRLLCPNCHSQTLNFAGRRSQAANRSIPSCSRCRNIISRTSSSGLCRKCAGSRNNFWRRKVVRPKKEELFRMVWDRPTSQIAKELNVSDKAISKWCKSYGISKPSRGYWAKKRSGKK